MNNKSFLNFLLLGLLLSSIFELTSCLRKSSVSKKQQCAAPFEFFEGACRHPQQIRSLKEEAEKKKNPVVYAPLAPGQKSSADVQRERKAKEDAAKNARPVAPAYVRPGEKQRRNRF